MDKTELMDFLKSSLRLSIGVEEKWDGEYLTIDLRLSEEVVDTCEIHIAELAREIDNWTPRK